MSYYYPGQSTAVSTASTPALPSPSNLDISCIIDPVGGKNGLYVGNITAATNHEMLMSTNICDLVNGIKAMLTSAMEANFIPDSSVTPYYLKLPALDYPAFSLDPYFEQAADFINQNISLTNVLVHCMAGVSRSVSFVIAYLMKYRRMTFDDALILMRSRRSISNPNEGFIEQLRKYAAYIKKQIKAEQKKRRKLEKMLKNHHPALNQIYLPQSEENQQVSTLINEKKSALERRRQQQIKSDKSKTQQPNILQSSQTFNIDALKSSNLLPRGPGQQDLYMSQVTKPQQPSKQSSPLQQITSQSQIPQTGSFLAQLQVPSVFSPAQQQKSQNAIPSSQNIQSTQKQQQYQNQTSLQIRPSTPGHLQAQNQYDMQPKALPYNMYNSYNMYNQANMYPSQNQLGSQNQSLTGQMNSYTTQAQFQQNQYSSQQLQYNQMLAQQQLSTSVGGVVDSRTADPIQKLKSMQDVQIGRRNNIQQQNTIGYGQNMMSHQKLRGGYGFY